VSVYTKVTEIISVILSLDNQHPSDPSKMLTHLQTGTAEKSGLAFISLQFLTRYLLIHWKKTTWHLVCRKYSPIRDMQSGVHAGEIWQHCTGWGIVLDQCFQGTSSPTALFGSSLPLTSQKSVLSTAFYLFHYSGLLHIRGFCLILDTGGTNAASEDKATRIIAEIVAGIDIRCERESKPSCRDLRGQKEPP